MRKDTNTCNRFIATQAYFTKVFLQLESINAVIKELEAIKDAVVPIGTHGYIVEVNRLTLLKTLKEKQGGLLAQIQNYILNNREFVKGRL